VIITNVLYELSNIRESYWFPWAQEVHWSYKISGRAQNVSFPQLVRFTFHAAEAKGTVIGYEISGQFETKILRQNIIYENNQDATV